MTLPALFRKVGINVPRHVTVGGQVILDRDVSASVLASTSYTHTSVKPHRFHGGEDPSPAQGESADAWWIRDIKAKDDDIEDMRKRFPGVIVLDEGDSLAYGLHLDTGRGKFRLLIVPRSDKSLPSVVVVEPKRLGRTEGRRFKRAPHLYDSDALCVASTSDWEGHNYQTSVAAAWAAHWLACYTEWRISGIWPTEGYGASVA